MPARPRLPGHALLLLLVCLQPACEEDYPPSPDVCDQGMAANVSRLELGNDDESQFTLLRDGQELALARGFQGGFMVGLRLRVYGTQLPQCLIQHTQIETSSGELSSDFQMALNTYEDEDGARSTAATFIMLDNPARAFADGEIIVRARVGDQEVSRRLRLAADDS